VITGYRPFPRIGSTSGGSAFVMMAQTSDFGHLDYFTVGERLYSS
jgi:hypothetical protein